MKKCLIFVVLFFVFLIPNYNDALTSDLIQYSGTGTSWVYRGLDHANVITVGSSGCDYTDIQTAIDAASTGYIIKIYPGTYTLTANLNVNKAVALVGINREKCKIQMENVVTGTVTSISGVVNCTIADTALMNLTIDNIGAGNGTNTTPAVVCSSGACHIFNCKIRGNGGRDIFPVLGTAEVYCFGVEVEQYAKGSSASHLLWVDNSANLTFEYSKTVVLGTGSGAQLNTTGNCVFRFCFLGGLSYAIDVTACGNLDIYHCTTKATSFFATQNYSSLSTNLTDDLDISVGDIDGEYITCPGTAMFGGISDSSTMKWDTSTNKLIMTNYGEDGVNLYSQTGETPYLKSDNDFSAASLNAVGGFQANGTTVITGAGFFQPVTSTDAAAPNNSIYYSSTQGKLVYKDVSGTVNNFY